MRRRRKDAQAAAEAAEEEATAEALVGPFDIADVDVPEQYIDLGSLLLWPPEGLDLQLQVDDASGEVMSALVVGEQGLIELRAFASSRGGDLWSDARREIAADTARRGGTATVQDGPFGPELVCQIPMQGADGESMVQPSRVIGVTGPRWFLRATIAGRAAVEPEQAAPLEDVIRGVVVNRGKEPMPPGAALGLQLPPDAHPIEDAVDPSAP